MRPDGELRAVRAAVLFGITVVFVSEALGAFDAFARGPVVAAWLVAALAAAVALHRAVRHGGAVRTRFLPAFPRHPVAAFSVACVLFVLAACLITALLSPPNNWDVLTYHLPRVRHWIQNRSFAHYPSHSVRQISFPPGAGYFVAQLQVLTGGDRLASLPQWSAFLGCILVTTALARRLGGPRAALPAALACATAPMAVMQATNPQTDLMAAFWLACFVYLVFARPRYRLADIVWLGGALGLGLATKPTVLLFAPPFVAILAMRAARPGWRAGVAVPIAVLLLAVLPTLPNAIRNTRTFGRPLGPYVEVSLTRRDLRVVTSNVLRHAALNYPSAALWAAITWAHTQILHLDASDPATTLPKTKFDPVYISDLRNPTEDYIASPVHLTIALVAAAVALTRPGRRRGRAALRVQLAVALAAAFLLYCSEICWQPWANRLLLPLLVLASPLIGWALAAAAAPLRAATCGLLGAVGILLSLTSLHHPLIALPQTWTKAYPSPSILTRSREDLYFANYNPDLRGHYEDLLRQATSDGCARVGLVSTEHDPEYLLWVTLDRVLKPAQIRHVDVENASRAAGLEFPWAEPCGLVTMQKKSRWGRYVSLPGTAHPGEP